MSIQMREGEGSDGGPTITIKICHVTSQHELSVPAQSSFGELKRVLAQVTGLEPQDQKLVFRGKEKDNEERLHMAGVGDMAKIILLEDPASKARKLEKMNMNEGMSEAYEAVVIVRSEVDKLAEKTTALELEVNGGTKVVQREFLVLTELLMAQLLKLDGIEAEGEAKVQRRIEARRIQSLVDTLDVLKTKNSTPSADSSNVVSLEKTRRQSEKTQVSSSRSSAGCSCGHNIDKSTDNELWGKFADALSETMDGMGLSSDSFIDMWRCFSRQGHDLCMSFLYGNKDTRKKFVKNLMNDCSGSGIK